MLPEYNKHINAEQLAPLEIVDILSQRLQKQCDAEVQRRFGAKVMERWQDMQGFGLLPEANCQGTAKELYISITIYLQFIGNRVVAASFDTNGCGAQAVCGAVAVELARGRTSAELLTLTVEDFFEVLSDLPRRKAHYVHRALEALQTAAKSCP